MSLRFQGYYREPIKSFLLVSSYTVHHGVCFSIVFRGIQTGYLLPQSKSSGPPFFTFKFFYQGSHRDTYSQPNWVVCLLGHKLCIIHPILGSAVKTTLLDGGILLVKSIFLLLLAYLPTHLFYLPLALLLDLVALLFL